MYPKLEAIISAFPDSVKQKMLSFIGPFSLGVIRFHGSNYTLAFWRGQRFFWIFSNFLEKSNEIKNLQTKISRLFLIVQKSLMKSKTYDVCPAII